MNWTVNTFLADVDGTFSEWLMETADVEVHPSPGSTSADDWFTDGAAGKDFLVFAQDGTGSMFALWTAKGRAPEASPVVLLGSEGDSGIIAPGLREFFLLLGLSFTANGLVGRDGEADGEENQDLVEWLQKNHEVVAPEAPAALLDKADQLFPGFDEWVQEQLTGESDGDDQADGSDEDEDSLEEGDEEEVDALSSPPTLEQVRARLERAGDTSELDELFATPPSLSEFEDPAILPLLFAALERTASDTEDDGSLNVREYLEETFFQHEWMPQAEALFLRKPSFFLLELIKLGGRSEELCQQLAGRDLPEELREALEECAAEADTSEDDLEDADDSDDGDDVDDELEDTDDDEAEEEGEAWEPVKGVLDLRGGDGDGSLDAAGVARLAKSGLEVRRLICTSVDTDALGAMAEIEGLEGVDFAPDFDNVQSARAFLYALRPLAKKVVGLTLSGLRSKDIAVVGELTSLERLELNRCVLRDESFASLAGLVRLRELDVSDHKSLTGAGLAHLPAEPLRKLNIANLGSLSAEALQSLARFEGLEELNVTGNSLKGWTGPLGSLGKLRSLTAGYSGLTDGDLAVVEAMPELRTLVLYQNPLGDGAIPHLLRSRRLERLTLSGTRVTDAGVPPLTELQELTDLDLSETRITDAGVQALAGMKRLRELSIGSKGITEACVPALKQMTWLETLSIDEKAKISKKGKRELEKALPECHVS